MTATWAVFPPRVYPARMQRDRAERVALIEAAFRIANERMAAWEEVPADAEELFFCECSKLDCRQKVPMTSALYETVRSQSQWFLIMPGHEVPDLEEVVQRGDAHWIIEKPELVGDIVRGTDPRTPEPGPELPEVEDLAEGIDGR
jgi:hypothetical protein